MAPFSAVNVRLLVPMLLVLCLGWLDAATSEEARSALQAGVDLMQQAQNGQVGDGTIVKAAVQLIDAKKMFEALGDEPALVEVRSCLYWCKKKMTNDELDKYLAVLAKSGDTAAQAAVKTIQADVEMATKVEVTASDAQTFLSSAEQFAKDRPAELFQAHVRYLEVAERFAEADAAVATKANRLASEAIKAWVEQQQKAIAQEKKELEKGKAEIAAAQKQLGDLKALGLDTIFEKKVAVSGTTPAPDGKALRDAEKQLTTLYARQLKVTDRLALSRFLLREALKSKDDLNMAYVMALEAVDVAKEKKASDLWTVLKATEYLGKTFSGVDPSKIRTEAFKTMGAFGKAGATLSENPEDATANTWAGLAVAFAGGELNAGMAMLQKSHDPALVKASQMEALKPSSADQQLQLAEAWDVVAKNRDYKDLEVAISARALHWYEGSVATLTGATQKKVETRIGELHKLVPLDPNSIDFSKERNLTEAVWLRLPGTVIEVDSRRTVKTNMMLGKDESVRIVPRPGAQWEVGTYSGALRCGWQGTSEYYFDTGGMAYGSLAVFLDKADRPLRCGIIAGPGHILFEQWRGPAGGYSQTYASSSKGSIPVKIIPVIEGFAESNGADGKR